MDPKPDPVRRNPGRMDGRRWKGSTFICSGSVDGGQTTQDIAEDWNGNSNIDDDWDDREATERPRESETAILLCDIARPAKPKGGGLFRKTFFE